MTPSVVERYLRLGLELGQHVEGIVDAYYGPPELADAVDAEPPVDPRALVSAAELLLDELEDGWLRDRTGDPTGIALLLMWRSRPPPLLQIAQSSSRRSYSRSPAASRASA